MSSKTVCRLIHADFEVIPIFNNNEFLAFYFRTLGALINFWAIFYNDGEKREYIMKIASKNIDVEVKA